MAFDHRNHYLRKRLFEIGSLNFSEGIERLIDQGRLEPMPYVERHLRGDWGEVTDEQWRQNNAALQSDSPLHSFYVVTRELAIMVITAGDRSATCVALPDGR
jgi:hypothetical protein